MVGIATPLAYISVTIPLYIGQILVAVFVTLEVSVELFKTHSFKDKSLFHDAKVQRNFQKKCGLNA